MSAKRSSSVLFPFSLVWLVTLVLGASPLGAQQPDQGPRVTVTGTVSDTSGAVLPATTIEAVVDGKAIRATKAGPDGRYRIEAPAGVLVQLRARRDGFAEQLVELQTVSADATRDIVLGIGAISDTVVVTASRTEESRATTTESIAVLDVDDIQELGSSQLGDVVRWVPGLYVEATGREGSLASLFARGGESDYNLVLVDGVRVNDNGGFFDFSRISGGEIDRVEVVRGAQSALYGSDPIGSVVQIFTRRAGGSDPPQLSGSVAGGTFNTWRGDLRVLGGARGRVDYHAGVSYRGSDGAFSDILTEADRFDQAAFDGNVGTMLGGHATLRTGLRYSDARGRLPGQISYGPGDTGTSADTEDLSWHLDFSQPLTSQVSHAATVAYFRTDRISKDRVADPSFDVYTVLEGTPGAIFPESPRLVRLLDATAFNALLANPQALGPGQFLARTPFGVFDFTDTSENRFRRPAVKYQANVAWMDDQILSAGYEYERESDLIEDYRSDTHAYFIQQQFTVRDRWFAGLGVRMTDNSRYGTDATPKVSLGWYVLPFNAGAVSSVKLAANFGKGIKNPNFFELFPSSFSDGNPALRPERARTIDVGAELTLNNQRWLGRVTYFDNKYTDQVAFRSTSPFFVPDGTPDYLNIDGSKAHGWEIEGALQRPVAGFTASAGYAFVDSRVVEFISTSEQFQPGQPLLRRPKHSSTFRLTYVRGRGGVNVNVRYGGQRHDAAFLGLTAVPSPQFPDGRPVDITVNPGYTLVGLGGDFRVRDALTLFVRIDNLTNETYESALGFPGLPRAAMFGARFNLGTDGRR
jgi:outer membrane cobalamin receptor